MIFGLIFVKFIFTACFDIDTNYTYNTGLETPFVDSIVLCIPKTTLLVVSWVQPVA